MAYIETGPAMTYAQTATIRAEPQAPNALGELGRASAEYAEAAAQFIDARNRLDDARSRWSDCRDAVAKLVEVEGV